MASSQYVPVYIHMCLGGWRSVSPATWTLIWPDVGSFPLHKGCTGISVLTMQLGKLKHPAACLPQLWEGSHYHLIHSSRLPE